MDCHHLAEVLGARYPDSPIEHLDGKAVRLNNNLAVKAFFSALARKKPRMLVLEDLHWADGGSIEAVRWLAQAALESPLLVLLLYRPGYEPPEEARRMVLSELPASSLDELLSAHLGIVPDVVARLVKERAGGNPFYVEELVRYLLESGVLGMGDTGYELMREICSDDLPPGIESLIAARLDRLSRDARDVAGYASVIGRSFLLAVLKRLKSIARKVEPGVTELLSRQVIFPRAAKPPEYIFKHALTRDVAYAGMLVSHRRRVHAAVALAIEEIFAEDRESYLTMLGHHWEQAGRAGKARECYLAGARAAVKRYAHDEAEHAYRGYLRLVKRPTEESIQVRSELGEEVLEIQGQMQEAMQEHRRALDEARTIGSRRAESASLRNVGGVCWNTGRMEKARDLYKRALAIAREAEDLQEEGIVLGNLASLEREEGHAEDALPRYQRALRIARKVRNREKERIILGSLANLYFSQGRMEKARGLYGQALRVARETGDLRLEGIWHGNLALLNADQGLMKEARDLYEQVLAVTREVGDRRWGGVVLGNLGNLYHDEGRKEEARNLYKQALAIAHETGNRSDEGTVVGNLGNLYSGEGLMNKARTHYRQALAITRELHDRRREGIWLGSLAALRRLTTGERRAAKDLARNAETILSEVGDKLHMARWIVERGFIALAGGKSAEATLRRACELASDLGIKDECELGKVIAQLRRAQAAFDAGKPLVCGQCREDLTEGQLAWLAEHRPEVLSGEPAC